MTILAHPNFSYRLAELCLGTRDRYYRLAGRATEMLAFSVLKKALLKYVSLNKESSVPP